MPKQTLKEQPKCVICHKSVNQMIQPWDYHFPSQIFHLDCKDKEQTKTWLVRFRKLFPDLADDLNMGAAVITFIQNVIKISVKEEKKKWIQSKLADKVMKELKGRR